MQSADILLLHDWPSGMINNADAGYCDRANIDEVGNEYARMLVDFLKPRLVLCGHLHKRYRHQLFLRPNILTDICCMANVQQRKDAIAVFDVTPEEKIGEVTEG